MVLTMVELNNTHQSSPHQSLASDDAGVRDWGLGVRGQILHRKIRLKTVYIKAFTLVFRFFCFTESH